MATYNLGRFLPIFRGSYTYSTEYAPLDIVYYNGSSYVAKQTTIGNLPTHELYWQIIALKGELSPTLSQEQVNSIIQQITGNANFVSDANYVHTDCNFTASHLEAVNNIGDATITIKQNGTTVGTFSTNTSTNATVNLTVPTNINQLTGGDEFLRAPLVEVIDSDEVIIPEIIANTVYYFELPLKSLSFSEIPELDIKTRYQSMPTYFDFTTGDDFSFDTGELEFANEMPEFEPNSKYLIKYYAGVFYVTKIVKN